MKKREFANCFSVCGLVLIILSIHIRASVIVSEEFIWKYQSVANHSCKTFKHTLKGPGILTVRTKMNPFRFRDFPTSKEDILSYPAGYFAESLGRTINGIKNADIQDFEGRSVDRISKWRVPAKNVSTEFKVCNPVKCNFAGDCSQYQANASIIIDYTEANSKGSGSTNASVTKQTGITGSWLVIENGKVLDRMDVSVLGDGYKVEAKAGDNAPVYWSGFGVLQENKLIVATRNTSSGASGLVVMTFNGDRVHYRSYYLDGRKAWDGEFRRR